MGGRRSGEGGEGMVMGRRGRERGEICVTEISGGLRFFFSFSSFLYPPPPLLTIQSTQTWVERGGGGSYVGKGRSAHTAMPYRKKEEEKEEEEEEEEEEEDAHPQGRLNLGQRRKRLFHARFVPPFFSYGFCIPFLYPSFKGGGIPFRIKVEDLGRRKKKASVKLGGGGEERGRLCHHQNLSCAYIPYISSPRALILDTSRHISSRHPPPPRQ